MPAVMKGWIDRVFTGGWAYIFDSSDGIDIPCRSLIGNKPTVLIGMGGGRKATYQKYGYDKAIHAQIDIGIFAYCGMTDVQSHLILDIDGDENAPRREQFLEEVKKIAMDFISPTRQILNAKEDRLSGSTQHLL